MNVAELTNRFNQKVIGVDWDAIRKEQGVRVDMNLVRNLLVRYLCRNNVSVKDIVITVGLKYPEHRQIIYDIRDSEYSAYKRIEKELGLLDISH